VATTIGVARLTLYLEGTSSLKDKRRVVKSLTQRIRNQFNVGVAESGDLDDMRVGTLVIVCVSNSAAHVDEMLATVIRFVESRVKMGVLGDVETELIPYGD
jgi:uncharacterized protein YlxP (DUF503 family)